MSNFDFENVSIIMSESMVLIKSRSIERRRRRASNLSWFIVCLSRFFIIFNLEKLLSHFVEPSGSVKSIKYNLVTAGNATCSWCFFNNFTTVRYEFCGSKFRLTVGVIINSVEKIADSHSICRRTFSVWRALGQLP